MFPGNTDDLTEKIRKGDYNAFELLYGLHRDSVYNLAIKYLKDPQLAEDAVQDVFLKIWSNREKLKDNQSIKGLLFTSLKNHVLNMIKTKKRRVIRQFEYLKLNPVHKDSTDSHTFVAELEKILLEGMEQLPDRKQTVYRMKRLEGYSNKEIANQLDISVNTVKSQFRRANNFIIDYVSSNM